MKIEELVAKKHLLTHPFYERWQSGNVRLEVLSEYARQYYHYETSLPGFLNAALDSLPPGKAADAVSRVKVDEESNPRPHSELWLKFANALGVNDQDAKSSKARPGTTALLEAYTSAVEDSAESALGALFAYESQLPEVAQVKAEGLKEHFGVTDPEALAFFELHSVLDVEHSRALRSAFKDGESAQAGANKALNGWWGMLDQFETLSRDAA